MSEIPEEIKDAIKALYDYCDSQSTRCIECPIHDIRLKKEHVCLLNFLEPHEYEELWR